ncbi:FtsX-like permease family protein [Nocardioides sp. BGMRC 2183]|nr:FtsX-like permease family protein [Nocardioides sp. BGMRC 2183]
MSTTTAGLAARSLRHRPRAAIATFLAAALGTVLTGSFATLLQTSFTTSGDDAETLFVLGAVVGGWGAAIVLFSIASTVGLTTAQRMEEMALLRTLGATPAQVRRLVLAEATAIALVGAVLGAAVALLTGPLLFDLLSGELVGAEVDYAGGIAATTAAGLGVLIVAVLAAAIAARRATSGPALLTLRESRAETGRLPWWRVVIGVALVGYGVAMGIVTVTVTADDPDPYAAMSTSGSSSILVGVGLAVLAPTLLRWGAAPALLLGRRSSSLHLASYNTVRRARTLSAVLAPVIVLTSAAVGTLMLVAIDARTLPAGTPEAGTITLLNNVVVGMLALFAAIMVVNAFVASLAHRRGELQRLRLLGATPEQVRGTVLAEAAIVAVVGIVAGTLGSLATVVPFAVARDEGVVPDGSLWLPPVVLLAVVGLTVLAARTAVGPAARSVVAGEAR